MEKSGWRACDATARHHRKSNSLLPQHATSARRCAHGHLPRDSCSASPPPDPAPEGAQAACEPLPALPPAHASVSKSAAALLAEYGPTRTRSLKRRPFGHIPPPARRKGKRVARGGRVHTLLAGASASIQRLCDEVGVHRIIDAAVRWDSEQCEPLYRVAVGPPSEQTSHAVDAYPDSVGEARQVTEADAAVVCRGPTSRIRTTGSWTPVRIPPRCCATARSVPGNDHRTAASARFGAHNVAHRARAIPGDPSGVRHGLLDLRPTGQFWRIPAAHLPLLGRGLHPGRRRASGRGAASCTRPFGTMERGMTPSRLPGVRRQA